MPVKDIFSVIIVFSPYLFWAGNTFLPVIANWLSLQMGLHRLDNIQNWLPSNDSNVFLKQSFKDSRACLRLRKGEHKWCFHPDSNRGYRPTKSMFFQLNYKSKINGRPGFWYYLTYLAREVRVFYLLNYFQKMVPQRGIEPRSADYKTAVISHYTKRAKKKSRKRWTRWNAPFRLAALKHGAFYYKNFLFRRTTFLTSPHFNSAGTSRITLSRLIF